MKRIKNKKIIAIIIMAMLFSALYMSESLAAVTSESPRYGMQSYGRIEIDQNDDGTPEAIFDAQDIYNIAAKCQ